MEYHKLPVKEVLKLTESDLDGLPLKKVNIRRKFGKNIIDHRYYELDFWKLLKKQFESYQTWLLSFIAVFAILMGLTLHKDEQIIDGLIIAIILVINATVGIYQDYRAQCSSNLLSSKLKSKAIVMREGKKYSIDAQDLMVGDIVFIQEGMRVPADCRIIESKDLYIDESMLTGESQAVLKHSMQIKEDVSVSEQRNMAFMNTYVMRGTAKLVVTAIGKDTLIGQISGTLHVSKRLPFKDEINFVAKRVSRFAITLIGAIVLTLVLSHHDWLSIIMISSALLISAIPEGLPAIVTFALAMGSHKLTKKNALVKNKSLLETLGSIDTICSDKTGTLTENRMIVHKIFVDGKVKEVSGSNIRSRFKAEDTAMVHFRNCGVLTNEAKHTEKGFVGDPDDIALIDFFNDHGVDIFSVQKKYPLVDMDPFSSNTEYIRTYHMIDRKKVRYTKGAPEIVLTMCTHLLVKGKERKITDGLMMDIEKAVEDMSGEALRILALSYHKGGREVLIGFVGLLNKPKEGTKEVVQEIYDANIDLKMVTGDEINTAKAMARDLGFRNVKAISWPQMILLSEEEFRKALVNCNIFARMTPESKLRIVSALQDIGRSVAITGDGVNDVPALKKADVGIAMGMEGDDIAKDAADMVILDDHPGTIIDGIKQGRTIFFNIKKVIKYLLTSNLAEVFVVFAASLFFGGVMPYLAIHLLWVNLVTNLAPAMALGLDPPLDHILNRKPTGRKESLINNKVISLTFFIGLKKVIIMLALFLVSLELTQSLQVAQTLSFTWLVLAHFVHVVAIRFDERTDIFINKALNYSVALPIIFQLVILYTPISELFHVVPISLFQWIILMITFIGALMLTKILTVIVNRHYPEED